MALLASSLLQIDCYNHLRHKIAFFSDSVFDLEDIFESIELWSSYNWCVAKNVCVSLFDLRTAKYTLQALYPAVQRLHVIVMIFFLRLHNDTAQLLLVFGNVWLAYNLRKDSLELCVGQIVLPHTPRAAGSPPGSRGSDGKIWPVRHPFNR